jgi:hypothetical protein
MGTVLEERTVPVHSLSSRPGWGTPEVAYELGVSALNLVQVYPQLKNVLSAIEQFYVNQICVYCDFFVMRDIRIATCSRCVRSVGDNKEPETWPFCTEFVPKGEPEGCEWRRRERGSLHSLQIGAGVRSLLQKRQSWFGWGLCSQTVRKEQQSRPMYALLVNSS